jgi:hypothetical protein
MYPLNVSRAGSLYGFIKIYSYREMSKISGNEWDINKWVIPGAKGSGKCPGTKGSGKCPGAKRFSKMSWCEKVLENVLVRKGSRKCPIWKGIKK